jgi:hypothetical protein
MTASMHEIVTATPTQHAVQVQDTGPLFQSYRTYYGGGEKGYTDYPSLAQDRGEAPKACVNQRWR